MTLALSPQTEALVERVLRRWMPRRRISVIEWAEAYRSMAPGTTAIPGPYSVEVTPYLRGILDAVDEGGVWKVVCQKSAQVGWTDGVVNNVLARTIHAQPCPVLLLFPREASARDYAHEKLEPMVSATPALAELIDTRSRTRGQSALHRQFPGGFVKLVGSNSPSSVKSTPARIVIVEEPDDAARDVRGQGDAIKLAEERSKTYPDRLLLIGGTPSLDGISAIQQEMAQSDQRRFHVRCHECDIAAPLEWEHVQWLEDRDVPHPVYGRARPETAVYACASCGAAWDDDQRVSNIARSAALQAEGKPGVGWVAHATSRGVAGFYLSELYSGFPSSALEVVVERYLEAEHEAASGEMGAAIAFRNSALGLPWTLRSDAPEVEQLSARGEDYPWWTCPTAALVITAGVDVQHDRLHVRLDAWGRGEESWLVAREVLHGATVDRSDLVWKALTRLLARPVRHASGASLHIAAMSIDASDGQTSDAAYAWVREHRRRRGVKVIAVKGATTADREIFSPPRRLDTTRTDKASRYGLQVYLVGTSRAKDLIAARLKLTGTGSGRMHWPSDAPEDYHEQMTSEVKAPGRGGRLAWTLKAGARNEDLDTAVYSLHAARGLRLHLWGERDWAALEQRLLQRDLIAQADAPPAADEARATADAATAAPRPSAPPARAPRRRGGWMSGNR